jgi:hypothetical protein
MRTRSQRRGRGLLKVGRRSPDRRTTGDGVCDPVVAEPRAGGPTAIRILDKPSSASRPDSPHHAAVFPRAERCEPDIGQQLMELVRSGAVIAFVHRATHVGGVLLHFPEARSHALRGNAVLDAPRRPRGVTRDAERPGRHSHGDRGSECNESSCRVGQRRCARRNPPSGAVGCAAFGV